MKKIFEYFNKYLINNLFGNIFNIYERIKFN